MGWNPLTAAATAVLATLLVSCSSEPKTEVAKAPEKPPAPVTGRQAFQSMYVSARAWAVDAQPLQLRSMNLQELKSEKGRAGAWQAIFVSSQNARLRSYSFSVIE